MPKSSTLSLNLQANVAGKRQPATSRLVGSPHSPGSPPMTSPPRLDSHDDSGASFADAYEPHSPITSLPHRPRSPTSPGRKDGSKSIFSNKKASKSSSRIQHSAAESSIRQVSDEDFKGSPDAEVYSIRRRQGSSPDLSMASDAASVPVGNVSGSVDDSAIRNGSVKSQSVPHINSDLGTTGSNRKTVRPNKFNLLRSRSIRHEQSHHTRQKPSTPHRMLDPAEIKPSKYTPDMAGMKTAPLEKDRSFRDLIGSGIRGRSADRHQAVDSEDDTSTSLKDRKDPFSFSSSFKESGGAAFLSNIRSQGTKAADGIGKAGKGIFGKLARSGSSHEREAMPLPENYVCKVINLPLVEQTRKTRISKRLEASKDKTEFWMPALPWRCIDYLNMKGCEEEGLYRVPGSGKEIKNWQMRFDTEYDINLFDEPELYDINIIGSMFKAWLRDLPDEIFPKTTQHRIAEECAGAKETPQMLKDELSKLPPYHYYLLFAITCHISLLHSCSESNKMNYQNLCICFQPCMKIDAFCFQFLVLDWRNCWQGCWTEKTYLAEELRIMADHENRTGSPAPSHGTRMTNGTNVEDSRAVSSSESSKHSLTGSSTPDRSRHGGTGHSTQKSSHDESVTPTPGDQQPKKAEDAPKLSPVPLYSPMSVPAFAGSDDGY